MLRNFLKTAWRNTMRNKTYTAINVLGLCLGMTCCLFIFAWVRDEQSIDNFHDNGGKLFTVYQTISANGKEEGSYTTPNRFANGKIEFLLEGLKDAIPEVQEQAYYETGYELPWGHPETIQVGEKKLKADGSRAGEDFFKMFSYKLVIGSPKTALKELNHIAISRKMAELFFGTPANAMGKQVRYENKMNFTVSAVFENLPKESSLHFDFLLNWEIQKTGIEFTSPEYQTYVRLSPTADVQQTEAKMNRFLKTKLDKNDIKKVRVGLQRFGDRYLQNVFVNGRPVTGRIEYVRIFTGVAIFILIIACINFMNLATARSVKRAKEIGLRKVVGSSRAQLIAQFIGEALFFSFLAMVLAILFFLLLLPAFNHFTGKEISSRITHFSFWVSAIALVFITGLVAGSYPALYLSALKPVRVLKGIATFTKGALWFRKGLTVFQFALSMLLIIATLVITRQTNYVQHTNLGFDKENLVYIRIEGTLANRNSYLLFKNRVADMPGIAMVDRSTEAPHAMEFVESGAINWEGKGTNEMVGFKPASVGFDFIKLMDMKMAAGRDFSKAVATDSADAFMVNEEAVKEMGMKNPVGKWISAWAKKGHIIGILKDYHTHSLREPIKPVIIDVKEYEYFGFIIARTKPGKTKEALASLAAVYKDINPAYPFAYQFVDEEYRKLYSTELVISKLSVLFASLAILISCLGLLGLVMFSAEQRIKEIGIRKVLGASLLQIIALFSTDFLKLIMLAFLIAAPVGWFAMHAWLRDFAYRIPVSWWIFVLAGMSSLMIAMLTLGYQAVKAARANPVQSLKVE